MLDRVGAFLNTFDKIGEHITGISKSYQEAKSKLLDKGPSISTSAKKMMELGADYKSGATKIPNGYLNPDASEDDGDDE